MMQSSSNDYWNDSTTPQEEHEKFVLMRALCVVLCPLPFIQLRRSDKAEAGARHYEARGIVRGISPTVHDRFEHEHHCGFMPSMTMPFTPRDPKDIARLTLRDAIAFRLKVTDKDALIDNIRKIAASEVHLPQASSTVSPRTTNASSRLKEGDAMPVFGLTNENGERISLDTYHGKPFVITFIFTRCPMPNFCPRMSKNFAECKGDQAAATLAEQSFSALRPIRRTTRLRC